MLKIEGMQPVGGFIEQPSVIVKPKRSLQISDSKRELDTISMRSITPVPLKEGSLTKLPQMNPLNRKASVSRLINNLSLLGDDALKI